MGRNIRRGVTLLGKFINRVFTAFLAVLVTCNLYVIGARVLTGEPQPQIFGWSSAVVVSGSMEPAVSVNDMVVVHRQKEYDPGDVISFHSGKSVVTHRILEVTETGFITKGDANNTADRTPVSPEDIIGKVVFTIPGIGTVTTFLRTPLGLMCLTALGFALIIFPAHAEEKTKERKGGKYAKE